MKKRLKCLIRIMLAFAIFLSLLTSIAFAETQDEENTVRDVVLVLDCSGSMLNTDPHKLCATACELLIDQMPMQNARIAIIAYGYNDGSAYQIQNYTVNNPAELNLVNVVTPLAATSTVKGIDTLKETIENVTEKGGGTTPTGTALLSAIDLLEVNGATEGNACVVLISDGECVTRSTVSYDEDNANTAVNAAKAHGWPIFALQMNNKNENNENSSETKRMRHLAFDSGAVASGVKNEDYCYYNLTSFDQGNFDVSVALSNIFAWVANSFPPPQPETYTLPADIEYDVPNLTSEFNITVLGSSLSGVTITYPDGSQKAISTSLTTDKYLLTSVVPGRYYNVKLFCPEEGKYYVYVEGDGSGKDVAISLDISTLDLGLTLDSNPVLDTDSPLNKNMTINFTSHFFYRDIDILSNRYYEEKQPVLEIKGTGGTKNVTMEGSKDGGYSVAVPVADLANYGSAFEVRVRLDDKMFSSGCKYSNVLRFKTENLVSAIIDPALPNLTAPINSEFEKIDLSKYISNPDNDKQELVLECTSDRSTVFAYTCEDDYLKIESGLVPGIYEMQLKVKDNDMTEYLVLNPFTLTVVESPFTYEEIDAIEIWLDSYCWQETGAKEVSLNLGDYYYDPDGLEAVYANFSYEGEGTLYSCEKVGNVLTFTPLSKGDGSVTFTVSDQITEKTVTVNVEVVSGKAVFWAENWIWFAIAVGIFLLIVTILVAISKNTRVKGDWTFIFEESGNHVDVEHVNIRSTFGVARKKSFLLKDLFAEIVQYIPVENDPNAIRDHVMNYFRDYGTDKIVMKGVLGSTGFVLQNIPENEHVKITTTTSAGVYKKSVKVSGGKLVIELSTNGEFGVVTLVITMKAV